MVGYEVLRESDVKVAKHEARIPCAPVDSFLYVRHQFLTFPFFFDYDVDGDRLLKALQEVAKKYSCVCGRVVSDPQSLYAIEVVPPTEERHGFPFTEGRADISIAEAILKHTKLKEDSPTFPWTPNLPFFMESLDLPEILRCGNAPLMKVKLTHLIDGCVVNLTIAHLIVDGQRTTELFRDIGRAYCGQEVPDREFDRSCMWPDRLGDYFPFLGEEVTGLPRSCAKDQRIVGFPESYDQPVETEILVFSKEVLENLKKQVSPFLCKGQYVSRNDLILAFMWMLFAEIRTEHPSGTDDAPVDLNSVGIYLVIEYMKSGINVAPSSFFGNAEGAVFLNLEEEDLQDKPLDETLAFLALLSRKSLNSFREQPRSQVEPFLFYYHALNSSEFRTNKDSIAFALSNFSKTAANEVNFGRGKPVLAHITIPLPLFNEVMTAGPGPRNGEDVFVYCQFTETEIKKLEDSIVFQTCAPKMKRLYSDFSVADIRNLLRME